MSINTSEPESKGLKVNFFNDKVISVSFLDRSDPIVPGVVNFSNIFLRDASTSLDSVNPVSKQKLFSTGSIDRKVRAIEQPKIIEVDHGSTKESAIEVHWSDGNVSVYNDSFLRKYSCSEKRAQGKTFDDNIEIWTLAKLEKHEKDLYLDYEDYINDDKVLLQALINLNKFGITFVKNIPPQITENYDNPQEWFVENIAKRIGYIKETFYGKTFDVQSKKDAKNIAYTSSYLGLHMDLLYYESPPGLQFLHSITNRVSGGESFFADSFRAARHVLETHPDAYNALLSVPINFHYDNVGEHYFYSRPLIVEDNDHIDQRYNYPYVREVNYSPPFQAPFEYGITSPLKKIGEFENLSQMDLNYHHSAKSSGARYIFRDFHRGLKLFEDFINDKENQYKLKLEEGTCVIFDNRRVLHAREAFNPNEPVSAQSKEVEYQRWFKGCYLDKDAYQSKLRVLYRKFNIENV